MTKENYELVKEMLNFSKLSKEQREIRQDRQTEVLKKLSSVCKYEGCDIHKLVLDYKIKRFSELTRGIYKKSLDRIELLEYEELKDELIGLDICSRCYFETIEGFRVLYRKNGSIDSIGNIICGYNRKPLFNIESVECSNFKLKLQ